MENYKFNFTTKTLTITKAFADKAENPDSEEYILLMMFQQDFPNMTIVRKTHKTPTRYRAKSGEVYNCNQFKNLSYENMERFMDVLPEGKEKEQVKEAYEFLRYGTGLVQTSVYKAVREWFVAQFPHYRKDPLFYLKNEVKVIDFKPFTEQKKKDEQEAS